MNPIDLDVDLDRRRLLLGAALAATGATMLPVRAGFAAAPGDRRLMVVVLRGGLDGLAAVVPYADPRYRALRGGLALPEDALHPLDDRFALHPALAPLAPWYERGEWLIAHAVATPYRERSHFDAQDLLEGGGSEPHAQGTGWLNRAAAALHPEPSGIAIGPSVPLLLRGAAAVTSWAPSLLPAVDADFLDRVMHMYAVDPLLASSLQAARMLEDDGAMDGQRARGPQAFVAMMERAAGFMRADDGPRLAAVDLGGWDTHANQGLAEGRLANALTRLTEGLMAYRRALGPVWSKTAVLVVTEFGRTVRVNGSGGTDHGTASVAFLFGGSIEGGRMVGDWPGLARLHEDRDLVPANDLRALLKGTLAAQFGLDGDALSRTVFPGSDAVAPLPGILRA
jgi:uncharacterized protein (DUF1501 family)